MSHSPTMMTAGREAGLDGKESHSAQVTVSSDIDFGLVETCSKEPPKDPLQDALDALGLDSDTDCDNTDTDYDTLTPIDTYHMDPYEKKKAPQGLRNRKRDRFVVKNKSGTTVKVSVYALPPHKQFVVKAREEPRKIQNGESMEVEVTCGIMDTEGIASQWAMFVVEFPIQGSLLKWIVEKRVIVRRIAAFNVSAKVINMSPEARPFYPMQLRSLFDRYLGPTFDGVEPNLPKLTKSIQSNTLSPSIEWNTPRLKELSGLHRQRLDANATRKVKRAYEQLASVVLKNTHSKLRIKPFKKRISGSSLQRLNHLSALLCVEEHQMEAEIRGHDLFYSRLDLLSKRPLTSSGVLLYRLEAPGVGEGRPAVIIGDVVRMRAADNTLMNSFEINAYIHKVFEKALAVAFGPQILRIFDRIGKKPEDFTWHARFVINNSPFNVMNSALCYIKKNPKPFERFFNPRPPPTPSVTPSPTSTPIHTLTPAANPTKDSSGVLDSKLGGTERVKQVKKVGKDNKVGQRNLNRLQERIVEEICSKGNSNHGPYVIFGPPGTGKTTTLVAAMQKVLKIHKSALILAVTPSNYSADILAARLDGTVFPSRMFRLNHPARHQSVDHRVSRYCRVDSKTGFFVVPPLKRLKKFRVIVSTCVTSWMLFEAGLPSGHFTHVFFDESSQAMEPETLVPLCLAGPSAVAVLAGDHRQLGAVVHSQHALRYGLGKSLQERLLTSYPHYKDISCSGLCSQLTSNYRSHPALLETFSELFYDSKLEACADRKVTHSLTDWAQLPNRDNCPCLFYGIVGRDVYYPESGSLCNRIEASTLCRLIKELLFSDQYCKVLTTDDVGVIAPYRAQVLLIRKLLRSEGLGAIRVGSVDDFQGKEEKVIFISTVVSQDRPVLTELDSDSKNSLGMFSNPKRFNVAVSRAKALMVVVGNPFMLVKKVWWKNILTYCVKKKAYCGIDRSADFMSLVESTMLSLGGGSKQLDDMNVYTTENQWRLML